MKNKNFLLLLISIAILTVGILVGVGTILTATRTTIAADTVTSRAVAQSITASGSIHSQQEATLTFQMGGKLVYLPFKQGDSVYQGQTIAQLDTYALQKQLQIQANAYQVATNNNATVVENNQAAVLEGQTRTALDATNHNNYPNVTQAQVITDIVARMVQNSLLTQNTAQLQVDLANYALQLASLTAPFNGILVREDVTTPNINITPATTFFIADPSQKVFKAQIEASDIDFVSIGSKAVVTLDGKNKLFTGSVVTIYPQKQTLSTGEQVYNVDISASGLEDALFGQNGSVVITSNNQTNALLIPSWTIVNHHSVWVWNGKKAVVKSVTIGTTHGDMIEVTGGLSRDDKVITAPQDISAQKYQLQ